MNVSWVAVMRDIGIIFALTFVGGFVIGFGSAFAGQETPGLLVGLSNVFFGSVGFAISYLWATNNRWQHLFAVALGTWVLSLVNVLLGFGTILTWSLAIIPILIMMGLGSAVGSAFETREVSAAAATHHHGRKK
jgi:hypothetical protein